MREHRTLRWSGWTSALLLCIALAIGLTPSSEEQGDSISLQAASNNAHDAQEAAPILVGRAPAGDERQLKAGPVLGDEADGRFDPDLAEDPEGAWGQDEQDNQDEQDELDNGHIRDGAPLTVDHPLVAPVIAIQERHTRDLMKHPLVVGTATGMNEHGEIAIMVLAKAEITDLPASLGGVPVMVYVTGELFAAKGKPGGTPGGGGGTTIDRTARFDRPVPIGISTGHPDVTAGTLGCRVTDGTSVYALSNNHVYANQNQANILDPVLQPGRFDGGSSPDDNIGTLDDYEPLDFHAGAANKMDAAIVHTPAGHLGTSTPSDGYGTPKSTTASASINLRVRKYGRTTGQTNGRVNGINATVNVGYGGSKVARFVGQLVITPGSYSAGGDSGSLIVIQKGGNARKPVALLFAGSSTATIASPIGAILTRFGVTVDGD
jgi:hypothetical protein